MDRPQDFQPFTLLGSKLRNLRESLSESLDEVSGAVEIDTETLQRFESGKDRPSEDILMLLINHFAVQEDRAVSLWQLAGYDSPTRGEAAGAGNAPGPVMFVVSLDMRAMYSDSAHISADKNGVIFDFMQNGLKGQPVPVSRVGMSHHEAQEFWRVLGDTLNQAQSLNQPKRLPQSKNPKDSNQNHDQDHPNPENN